MVAGLGMFSLFELLYLRRAINHSSGINFRCVMARRRDRVPYIVRPVLCFEILFASPYF